MKPSDNSTKQSRVAIIQASDEMIEGQLHDQFIVDPIQGGAGTSMNMNANEVIANRATRTDWRRKGELFVISPNTHVNMAQSTNDAFPTAIHIAVLAKVQELLAVMDDLHGTFQKKAAEFQPLFKNGAHTFTRCGSDSFWAGIRSIRRVLQRDIERIQQLEAHLYEVNMGATAVGTGLNADPLYIEKVVEF